MIWVTDQCIQVHRNRTLRRPLQPTTILIHRAKEFERPSRAPNFWNWSESFPRINIWLVFVELKSPRASSCPRNKWKFGKFPRSFETFKLCETQRRIFLINRFQNRRVKNKKGDCPTANDLIHSPSGNASNCVNCSCNKTMPLKHE